MTTLAEMTIGHRGFLSNFYKRLGPDGFMAALDVLQSEHPESYRMFCDSGLGCDAVRDRYLEEAKAALRKHSGIIFADVASPV